MKEARMSLSLSMASCFEESCSTLSCLAYPINTYIHYRVIWSSLDSQLASFCPPKKNIKGGNEIMVDIEKMVLVETKTGKYKTNK